MPNAKEGRESVDFEIYGVNGIPDEAYVERAAKKARFAEANGEEEEPVATKQAISAETSATGQPTAPLDQQMPIQFGAQPQMQGMMYGRPMPGMGFNPMGQQGFPGMMGGPHPGFNPMQPGMPMHHGGPPMPPHMFGGPQGPNGQFQGMYGAPGVPVQAYLGGPGAPPGSQGPPPRGNLPPGHKPPPGLPPAIAAQRNGALPGGPPPGAPIAPVPPLFPAGAAAAPSERFLGRMIACSVKLVCL